MEQQINESTVFNFAGGTYTIDSFKELLKDSEKPYVLDLVRVLQKKGKIKIVKQETQERRIIDDILEEEGICNLADVISNQEEDQKDAQAEIKRKGQLRHKRIKLPFNSALNAQKSMDYIKEELRVKDMSIEYEAPIYYLVVKNVTEKELSAINKYYMAGKLVGAMVSSAEKGVKKVTDGINYTAKNVVNPLASISVRSISNIFSTVASVVAHTGTALVTAGAEGARKTKNDIISDPETIKATKELINAKDTIVRKFNSGNNTFSGIIIEDGE